MFFSRKNVKRRLICPTAREKAGRCADSVLDQVLPMEEIKVHDGQRFLAVPIEPDGTIPAVQFDRLFHEASLFLYKRPNEKLWRV